MPTTRTGAPRRAKHEPVPKNKVADGRTKLVLVLDDEMKTMVQMQAEAEHTTMSEITRRALLGYCFVGIQQAAGVK